MASHGHTYENTCACGNVNVCACGYTTDSRACECEYLEYIQERGEWVFPTTQTQTHATRNHRDATRNHRDATRNHRDATRNHREQLMTMLELVFRLVHFNDGVDQYQMIQQILFAVLSQYRGLDNISMNPLTTNNYTQYIMFIHSMIGGLNDQQCGTATEQLRGATNANGVSVDTITEMLRDISINTTHTTPVSTITELLQSTKITHD